MSVSQLDQQTPAATAEQLALLTDDDLRLIEAATDDSGDKRPYWWSQQLNVGMLRTLYHRYQGVALFIAWNLARMGPAGAHDLSAEQVARELGITRQHVQHLWKMACDSGDLFRRRENGHGRRLVTRPGVFVELHQPPVSVSDPPRNCRDGPDTSSPKCRDGPDTLKTLSESSERAARLDKSSRLVRAEDARGTRRTEPPVAAERFCDVCNCDPCNCCTHEQLDVGERVDITAVMADARAQLHGDAQT